MAPFFNCCWAAMLLLALATYSYGAPAAPEDCNLLGEADQESKTEQEILASLAPMRSITFHDRVAKDGNDYTYQFRLCGTVGNTTGGGLVQIDNKNSQKETVIGRFNETYLIKGSDWILLMYRKGEKYDHHCNHEERKGMVMISCNSKTNGDNFKIMSEEREKVEDCFYLFEMDSKAACPPEDTHLSVGSILLIVLASLVAVYLIVGFLYQRLVVGAKGMEQIPNYSFWQDLGNLMADGCDFACRSKPRSVPTAYRGVGDDQLGEEPEERDDHLLPM
ncbi:cation-dependent mannose-6-phosphate receptor [Ambystoma mexicanum]|uniref:cation-dependent mannose-6-phosphate receptor n=1 Tax=Ambystoma mexicanum TaxID=8296 RepID=UPI0037E8C7EF